MQKSRKKVISAYFRSFSHADGERQGDRDKNWEDALYVFLSAYDDYTEFLQGRYV